MAFTPGSTETDTNGTTNVTAVAAPASGVQRQISQIIVHNVDTAVATVNFYYNTNGTVRRIKQEASVAVGGSAIISGLVLDATTDSIEVDLGGAHTTTAPTIVATWADFS